MRLLDRYVFRELFWPLVLCLAVIQGVVIFFTMLGDEGRIQDAQLHFGGSVEYAVAASMTYLPLVLPVALLLALLWALTHHARYNEITAMRAAGISLWRICVPYFIVGAAASGALFALNESIVPWSTDKATQMLSHNNTRDVAEKHVRQLGFTNEHEHRLWRTSDYNLDTGEMIKPIVIWTSTNGIDLQLQADRGVWTNDAWTFFNFMEWSNSPASWVPMLQTNIPVKVVPEFGETPREFRIDVRMRKYSNFDPNWPLKDILAYLRWHPDLPRSQKSRLLTEFYSRISTPVTCMVVALIAIPFGAAPGRRNLFFGVAGSIFIFFAYYMLQHVCLAFGTNGVWPAWLAAWLPNLFFLLLGLILTIRIR